MDYVAWPGIENPLFTLTLTLARSIQAVRPQDQRAEEDPGLPLGHSAHLVPEPTFSGHLTHRRCGSAAWRRLSGLFEQSTRRAQARERRRPTSRRNGTPIRRAS